MGEGCRGIRTTAEGKQGNGKYCCSSSSRSCSGSCAYSRLQRTVGCILSIHGQNWRSRSDQAQARLKQGGQGGQGPGQAGSAAAQYGAYPGAGSGGSAAAAGYYGAQPGGGQPQGGAAAYGYQGYGAYGQAPSDGQ